MNKNFYFNINCTIIDTTHLKTTFIKQQANIYGVHIDTHKLFLI